MGKVEDREVRHYQPLFARWIRSPKWDSIAEELSDICTALITKVMNAEKDSDCSWLVWKNCDYVLGQIRSISGRLDRNPGGKGRKKHEDTDPD